LPIEDAAQPPDDKMSIDYTFDHIAAERHVDG